MSAPWDLYAKELGSLYYGFPLWDPKPGRTGSIEIGDVGYIEEGHFVRLFNPMLPEDHMVNKQSWGVPENYAELKLPPEHIYTDTIDLPGSIDAKNSSEVELAAKVKAWVQYFIMLMVRAHAFSAHTARGLGFRQYMAKAHTQMPVSACLQVVWNDVM